MHTTEPMHAEHPPSPPQEWQRIAPLWHTLLLIVVILAGSLLNVRTHHAAAVPHTPAAHSRLLIYLLTLGWEWLLLALMCWGIWRAHTPLRRLLGLRRPGATEFWIDVALGLGFWFGSSLVLALVGYMLRFAHLDLDHVRRAVLRLAPASPAELAVWVALSITAGICEELIFRGYLQQQFAQLTRSAALGIVISALVFGLAHGYEGVAGMVIIALYGALFGVLAHLRRSLRAGMIAHAWHDAMSGFVLYFGAHLLHRIPQ